MDRRRRPGIYLAGATTPCAHWSDSVTTKAPITLQDLRRRLYVKAKAEPPWRFWGLYAHICHRRKAIPKDGGTKVRVLSIPAIRDRVVQGAVKLIVEPIFEADFQPGSFGYRPKRSAHAAVERVAQAIVQDKTRVIDVDLAAYFDNVRHPLLLEKVARRVNDRDVVGLGLFNNYRVRQVSPVPTASPTR